MFNSNITNILFFVLAVLNIADVVTTKLLIDGGGYERNKVIAAVMDKLGVVPALLAVKVIMLAAIYAGCKFIPAPADQVLALLAVAAGYYVGVVQGNLFVIADQRKAQGVA